MKKSFSFLVICLFLFACSNEHIVFKSFKELPNNNWIRFNNYTFSYDVADTVGEYDIVFNVKIDSSYYEKYLFYSVIMQTPDNAKRYVERHLNFKDSANVFITSNVKDSLVYNQTIFSQIKFNTLGHHVFELSNLMSKFDNLGVQRIGITIRKSEKE